MADLTGLPPKLRQLQRRMILQVDDLSARMDGGQISPDAWLEEMNRLIEQFMTEAMETGKNGELTDIEQEAADRLAAIQSAFLENFRNDIRTNGWIPAYTSRAQMYATSTTTAYANGDVIRQAGQMLPLPSMPAEGTQCLTSCGCRWRVVVINRGNGDFDAYWELHKEDNCQTCIQRRAEWYPVQIRDGILQLNGEKSIQQMKLKLKDIYGNIIYDIINYSTLADLAEFNNIDIPGKY